VRPVNARTALIRRIRSGCWGCIAITSHRLKVGGALQGKFEPSGWSGKVSRWGQMGPPGDSWHPAVEQEAPEVQGGYARASHAFGVTALARRCAAPSRPGRLGPSGFDRGHRPILRIGGRQMSAAERGCGARAGTRLRRHQGAQVVGARVAHLPGRQARAAAGARAGARTPPARARPIARVRFFSGRWRRPAAQLR
jgi:hypothetical protein